jgi:hypothetical protein
MAKHANRTAMNPLPSLVRAAGYDAASNRMRAANRSKWNQADYNAAARTMNDLIQKCYGRKSDTDPNMAKLRFQIAEQMQKADLFHLDSDFDEVLATIDEIIANPVQVAA